MMRVGEVVARRRDHARRGGRRAARRSRPRWSGTLTPRRPPAAPALRADRDALVRVRRAGADVELRPRRRTPSSSSTSGTSTSAPIAVVSSWRPSSPSVEVGQSLQSPASERKRGLARRPPPDLFVAWFVGDHRHLSRGRFGPVRQRHRAGRLADGRVGGAGADGRGPGSSPGRRSAGSGKRAAGWTSSGGAGRRRRRRRLLRAGRSGPPSTAAWASSAPRIRTPSAGGASGRSSSKSGTRSSGTSALHQARPAALAGDGPAESALRLTRLGRLLRR